MAVSLCFAAGMVQTPLSDSVDAFYSSTSPCPEQQACLSHSQDTPRALKPTPPLTPIAKVVTPGCLTPTAPSTPSTAYATPSPLTKTSCALIPPYPLSRPLDAMQPMKVELPSRIKCSSIFDVNIEPVASPKQLLTPSRSATATVARSPISLANALQRPKVPSLELELSPAGSASPVQFPPGLRPPPNTPSHGSVFHARGTCRPCAWFWKPQSCLNGQDCEHCHLCPEGELKSRKKLKQRSRRCSSSGRFFEQDPLHEPGCALEEALALQSPHCSDHESTAEASSENDFTPSTLQESEEERSEHPEEPCQQSVISDIPCSLSSSSPTPGSALHGSGDCKPCAWFHKASGCQRGEACTYCHLCPEGELKSRKKAKHAKMRSDKTEAAPMTAVGSTGVAAQAMSMEQQERLCLGLADLL
mmetsp:Transcript_42154/g.106100  ORF Transcript_42154/g.106100 Transcript_42154/m.106100 type:complete len:417 (+) Transcript_42154:61-1311(+)|eukprot:CAMPEP_0115253424 /NCGR_PEP_ID=MMETSP0270-20121206/44663_1 /TAXON_ID=71861 /ORGANISM="Scrippsiella trochoidea, Strain CCMP3099" /LENGTH=416 /DNA_ID=CAMNT_0002668925 /DNA_START=12 /DNA_END=1262 /DNA_ORIENTATION=+